MPHFIRVLFYPFEFFSVRNAYLFGLVLLFFMSGIDFYVLKNFPGARLLSFTGEYGDIDKLKFINVLIEYFIVYISSTIVFYLLSVFLRAPSKNILKMGAFLLFASIPEFFTQTITCLVLSFATEAANATLFETQTLYALKVLGMVFGFWASIIFYLAFKRSSGLSSFKAILSFILGAFILASLFVYLSYFARNFF